MFPHVVVYTVCYCILGVSSPHFVIRVSFKDSTGLVYLYIDTGDDVLMA